MAKSSDSTNPDSPQSQNSSSALTRHTAAPWAYDEDTGTIYYADGDVNPAIAYIEGDNGSPEQRMRSSPPD